jgi:hypothetical protein
MAITAGRIPVAEEDRQLDLGLLDFGRGSEGDPTLWPAVESPERRSWRPVRYRDPLPRAALQACS